MIERGGPVNIRRCYLRFAGLSSTAEASKAGAPTERLGAPATGRGAGAAGTAREAKFVTTPPKKDNSGE
jgi:hypothetical protein